MIHPRRRRWQALPPMREPRTHSPGWTLAIDCMIVVGSLCLAGVLVLLLASFG